jgi:squalene-associated FAD-dependent desaturase
MSKSVIIIGGGLAGLASAVFLGKEGYDVSLFESAPKLGGRTYSFYDKEKEIYVDNGQHILAGWYENTFEYLKIIGTCGKLVFPESLRLFFCDKSKNNFELKCGNLPGVSGLITGIFNFRKFTFDDRIKFLNVRKLLNGKIFPDDVLKNINAGELLDKIKQTKNLKEFFWNPLIYAAFNTLAENVSADLFVKLIKKGTELKKNMSIILSDMNLNELFIDEAVKYLENKSAGINLSTGIKKINLDTDCVSSIETEDGKTFSADYYVCAVPNYSIKKLFENKDFKKYFCDVDKLKPSSIVSVHLFFKEELKLNTDERMIGFTDTIIQWAFIRSRKHICIVISGADFLEGNLTEKDNDEIFKICVDDLKSCLNGIDENNISDYKVIKEKRATFLPEVGSEKYRLNQKSNIKNLYIAGDWTDTGYPSTIEGAIKSAKICSDLIFKNEN